ncbi:alpha/beta hydrolase-fold protein [Muricauda sp. SCSIO 64092]|uniref:carboxylesterase family protein n=1 Tax=Allomuricauda sp. SCSIO 64092 TaxID=2908842 RepID=UPI001FF2CCC9|nr:alpha/beta hydrolase-fold protein [Muricauda sp. SCSIO 64092]UOY07356.1 alpha/beta hydrolase-fold protein [Muricauda sp. SCSIO 64092]
MLRIGYILFLLLMGTSLCAQDFSAYEKKLFTQGSGVLPYRILLPKNFDASKKYPLILFLHGSGERGNDNEKQLTHGGGLFLRDSIREQYPAIVVFPQCAKKSTWVKIDVSGEWGNRTFSFYEKAPPTQDMLLLEGLIKELRETYAIHGKQLYVGGLSMGGFGTFELVNRNPGLFSAAFPICGGANPKIARRLTRTDWWVFHGGADDVVPPEYSTQMVEALKAKRAKVKYSLYLAVKHNSWDYALKEPDLLPWLFSKPRLR